MDQEDIFDDASNLAMGFSQEVHDTIAKGVNPIDAVIHMCATRGIEPSLAADLLTADIKDQIRVEAISKRMIGLKATLSWV